MPLPPNGTVEALQASLALHWSAIEFYATVSAHLARWGYQKLGDRYAADAEEEREHARRLVERLEFFDAMPTREHGTADWPRDNVPGILDAQLEVEFSAAAAERRGWETCLDNGDAVSAALFAGLLADSEHSIKEIEAAKAVIGQIGLDNYLAAFI